MDIIKNLEPSTVALLGDLHKPYSVYNNLKELANLPNDPKSRNLFLIYKFFVTELAEKGQLTDDKIDETVHDCIMWFVSNPMSNDERRFFNKFMYNLLVMTGLIDNKTEDETNPEPEENDDDIDDIPEEDISEDDEDGDVIYGGGPLIDWGSSDDDEPDDLYEDEGVNNDDDEYDISEDDDIIEDEDDDLEDIFEHEDDVESDEEPNVNPVDIDASALARCYQCKNLVDNSTCNVEDKNIKVLCSSSYNWEHPCPNFEYTSLKKGAK